jgi:hypothetical protein
MAEYVVELYVPRTDRVAVARSAERARLAAEELTRQGTQVRYLRSIFVPEDETCFYMYEAVSLGAVREAVAAADLPCEHIAEAVLDPQ